MKVYPVEKLDAEEIVDTNGAGDAFSGGFIGALVLGKSLDEAVQVGHRLGSMCVGQVSCALCQAIFGHSWACVSRSAQRSSGPRSMFCKPVSSERHRLSKGGDGDGRSFYAHIVYLTASTAAYHRNYTTHMYVVDDSTHCIARSEMGE